MNVDKDLFGNDVVYSDPERSGGKRYENHSAVIAHRKLLQLHGETPDMKCKHCKHFIRKSYSKSYFKCLKFKNSNGPGTDWRANWQACGIFQPTEE